MKKHFFLLLFLVIIHTIRAQNPLDRVGLNGSNSAAAAFSLRLLTSNYSGPLARINIAGSNYDVWPDGNGVFSLSSPVSAANPGSIPGSNSGNNLNGVLAGRSASVVIWYDQSGFNRYALQATSANQPMIINNGSIYTENGKPAIRFIGANAQFLQTAQNVSTPAGTSSINAVAQNINTGVNFGCIATHVDLTNSQTLTLQLGHVGYSNFLTSRVANGLVNANVDIPSTPFLASAVYNQGLTLFLNGLFCNTNLGTRFAPVNASANLPLRIGRGWDNTTNYFDGYITEVITLGSSLTTPDRQLLEANQGTYYGITVVKTPIITLQPTLTSQNILAGDIPQTLSVAASGTNPTIQWMFNTGPNTRTDPIQGETSTTLVPVITPIGASNEGIFYGVTRYFYAQVTSAGQTVNSNSSGGLYIYPAPVFTSNLTQTIQQTVVAGKPCAPLSVTATGQVLTYQWYSSTQINANGHIIINGATQPTYTPPSTTIGTMFYLCYVRVGAALTKSNFGGIKIIGPSITQHPSNAIQTLNVGAASSPLSITDDGVNETYQWYSNSTYSNLNGTPVLGANSRIFFPPTNVPGTNCYYAVVSAYGATATSYPSGGVKVAYVAPVINVQPSTNPQIVNTGAGTSTLNVGGIGISLTYQWYRNTINSNTGGTLIPGATSSSFTPPSTNVDKSYYYATVSYGTAVSTSNVSGPVSVNKALNMLGLDNTAPGLGSYALRQLASSYSGPLVRVNIGNMLYDVWPDGSGIFSTSSPISSANPGTIPGTMSGANLGNILGGNNSTVAIWYDQTGNGNHQLQPSNAYQPQIASAGVINLQNGKPSIRFIPPSYFETANGIITSGASSVNAISQNINTSSSGNNQPCIITSKNDAPRNLPTGMTSGMSLEMGYLMSRGGDMNGNLSVGIYNAGFQTSYYCSNFPHSTFMATGTYGGTSVNIYVNGTAGVANNSVKPNTYSDAPVRIGRRWDLGDSYDGMIAEINLFGFALSQNQRQAMENSQANYFNIVQGMPTIKTNPIGGSQLSYASVGPTISIDVCQGSLPVSYQWYKNPINSNVGGTPIPGANSNSLTVPTTTLGTFSLYVVISFGGSTLTSGVSSNWTILAAPPVITSQPSTGAQTAFLGNSANSLSINATGLDVTYKWYKNTVNSTGGGILVPGANSNLFTPVAEAIGTFYYFAQASSYGATSTSAVSGALTVVGNIQVQPSTTIQNLNVAANASTLFVNASGNSLSYQWYSNALNGNTGGTAIIGANASSYQPSTANPGTLYYYVVVTNGGISTTSNASGAVKAAYVAPVITSHPSNATQLLDLNAASNQLSVTASGSNLTYQWYSNSSNSNSGGTAIPGAISNTYSPSTAALGILYYYVIVRYGTAATTSNVSGSVTVNVSMDRIGLNYTTPAVAAYALRQLASSYTGPLVRINISNNLYDIWPDGTGIFSLNSPVSSANPPSTPGTKNGVATLASLIASNSATVAIWYDQSGKANHQLQPSTGLQPKIIDVGNIVLQNGKPSMRFIGSSYHYFESTAGVVANGSSTVNAVAQSINTTSNGNNQPCIVTHANTNGMNLELGYLGGNVLSSGINNGNFQVSRYCSDIPRSSFIATGTYGGTSANLYVNGLAAPANNAVAANNNASSKVRIGRRWDNPDAFDGYIAEVVLFPSALSAGNRQQMESNQSTYFGIGIGSPTISLQPSTTAQNPGAGVSATALTVTACVASGGLSYQWYSNVANSNAGGTAISAANSNSYTPTSAAIGTFYYYVVVSANGQNITSNVSGPVTVNFSAPVITVQPSSSAQSVSIGNNANTLSVTATGLSLTYQWYKNTSNRNTGGVLIGGATSSTYAPATGSVGVLYYYVVVTSGNVLSTVSSVSGAITVTPPPPPPGNALDLDGNDDYVAVAPGVYFNADFTIEAWVYPRNFGNWSRIIDFGNGAGSNNVLLSVTYGTSGYPGFYVGGAQFASNIPLTLNKWNHVAATLQGNTATIYVNGIAAGTANFPVPANITRNLCYIGKSNWNGDPNANAIFDELRIWNVARTQAQIQANMTTVLSGSSPGMVLYYNFDQGTPGGNNAGITTLFDQGVSGKNGTLNNFALNGATSNWVNSTVWNTWTGATNNDWTNPANWQFGTVPGVNDNASIPSGKPNLPVRIVTAQSINQLANSAASQINVSGNGVLQIGNYILNGVSAGPTVLAAPPVIMVQPSSSAQVLNVGAAATVLTVTATGYNPTYQWYSNTINSNTNGTAISGETGTSYTPSTAIAGTMYYYMVVSNVGGSVASSVSGNITVSLITPTLSNFNNLSKTTLDAAFTIAPPTSNSAGAFSYTSSNGAVATISGNQVSIIGAGAAVITATQAATASYSSKTITATLTVTGVPLLTTNGQITSQISNFVNKNGTLRGTTSVDKNGKVVTAASGSGGNGMDGLTAATASSSAYAIKQAYPASTDGYYWIINPNVNGGAAFRIYADMTTDGGGWTLILCNTSYSGWTYQNAVLLNQTNPSNNSNYSIIAWADYIKKSASGFQYMIDGNTRRTNGAIWTANQAYSFTSNSNSNTNITINTKFTGFTDYNDNGGIGPRMPWWVNNSGFITTSSSGGGYWWGTLVTNGGWSPTPWLQSIWFANSNSFGNNDLGVIWYWVR